MIMTTTMMTMMTITLTILIITMKMSKKMKTSRNKNSPFECGFNQMSHPRMPMSIHFFLIAIMFIIFDMEISIILPMMNTKMINLNEWVMSSLLVMIILMFGLMHEWKNSMLEWTK